MAGEITLEFIGRSLLAMQDEMRSMRGEVGSLRGEVRDMRSVVLSLVDSQRRMRDDLELMIRSESMGRAAHFETMFERKLDDLRDRVDALEAAR